MKEKAIEKPVAPIIWKRESCLNGECKDDITKHAWCLPYCVPSGLAVECLHCHKARRVKVKFNV